MLPHSREWKSSFEKEKVLLERALNGMVIGIEHVGSTSVTNILAKPIIDISVGIKNSNLIETIVARLSNLGYKLARKMPDKNFHLFFVKGTEVKRTHYLHLLKHGGKTWENDLLFRDYLRTHKLRAQQYSKLKEGLASRYLDNRQDYTRNKEQFILDTIKRASKND